MKKKEPAISLVGRKEKVKMYEFYSNWLNLSSIKNPTSSLATHNKHQKHQRTFRRTSHQGRMA